MSIMYSFLSFLNSLLFFLLLLCGSIDISTDFLFCFIRPHVDPSECRCVLYIHHRIRLISDLSLLRNTATLSLGGIVTYTSPILLKGAHDKVLIDLVDKSPLDTDGNDLDELKESGVDAKLNMERS